MIRGHRVITQWIYCTMSRASGRQLNSGLRTHYRARSLKTAGALPGPSHRDHYLRPSQHSGLETPPSVSLSTPGHYVITSVTGGTVRGTARAGRGWARATARAASRARARSAAPDAATGRHVTSMGSVSAARRRTGSASGSAPSARAVDGDAAGTAPASTISLRKKSLR